jgi:hypothetical protein
MSSSSFGTSSPCKFKLEGELVGCLLIKKIVLIVVELFNQVDLSSILFCLIF